MTKVDYKAVFDKSPCAIFITDDEGKYVDINAAAIKILGAKKEDILGKKVTDFVAPMRETYAQKLWDDFKVDGYQSGTFIISQPEGIDRIIKYSAVMNFVPGLHMSFAFDPFQLKQE